ncbi:MAG: Mur ligase family protein, partial [Nitrospirota bacterium]
MTVALEPAGCTESTADGTVALFTSADIAALTGGALSQGAPGTAVRRVWTDSRTVRRGDLFVALAGARFDGHRFVAEALRKGAVGALVRHGFKLPGTALLIAVDEPLRAFQDLARAHRRRFDIPVVAVSGSNGKTTTKDMIAAILAERFITLKTEGNLNNHIGVPQTLLRLAPRHEAAVIEMGI